LASVSTNSNSEKELKIWNAEGMCLAQQKTAHAIGFTSPRRRIALDWTAWGHILCSSSDGELLSYNVSFSLKIK